MSSTWRTVKYKRCRDCAVPKLPTELLGGRCGECRPKKPQSTKPAEQLGLALEVPTGCTHQREGTLVCESCASLVRPLGGGDAV